MMGDDGPVEDQTMPAAPPGPPADAGRWALPGSAEEQPTPAPSHDGGGSGDGPADGGSRVVEAAPADAAASVPQVTLRPMTLADILDGGFAVVKARPRRIFGLAAAVVVPAELVMALVERSSTADYNYFDFFNDPTVANERVDGGDLAMQYVAIGVYAVLYGLALVFLAAAIGHLVGQWVMGRDAPAGEMVRTAGRRWWPLVASFFVVKLAEAASVVGCYIGLLFVMPLFVAVAPVIGVEGGRTMEAVRRSVRLVRPRYFPVMGTAVVMGIVATLLVNALSALPQALAAWLDPAGAWVLVAVGSIVSEIVVLPFVAAATVLLYFDLRVRTEGLDLEMTASRVLDRAG